MIGFSYFIAKPEMLQNETLFSLWNTLLLFLMHFHKSTLAFVGVYKKLHCKENFHNWSSLHAFVLSIRELDSRLCRLTYLLNMDRKLCQ